MFIEQLILNYFGDADNLPVYTVIFIFDGQPVA